MSITKKLKLRLKSAIRTHREFDEFIEFMIEALSGGGGSGGGQQIEYHTLNAGNISTKSFLLNFEPASANSIEVTIQGGPDQFYNIDFGVTAGDKGNNRIIFTGYGLNPIVEVNDIVKVSYNLKPDGEV